MRIQKTPAEKLLLNLSNQIKAVIETQAVLQDGVKETKRLLREVVYKMDEIETTGEVVKLSLRRKTNVEELGLLEKKVYDLEEKLSALSY